MTDDLTRQKRELLERISRGVDSMKTAFECIETLAQTIKDRVDAVWDQSETEAFTTVLHFINQDADDILKLTSEMLGSKT